MAALCAVPTYAQVETVHITEDDGIVALLGAEDTVTSPTFALVNQYEGTQHRIYHFDFYRTGGRGCRFPYFLYCGRSSPCSLRFPCGGDLPIPECSPYRS